MATGESFSEAWGWRPNQKNAWVDSPAEIGMNVRESKIEAAKEGWALATSSQAAFWGDRVGRPKVSMDAS